FHFGCADGLHELFTVVSELVDRMHVIVQDPYMFFRIVGIDRDEMGALENLVPLRPSLNDVAVRVGDDDAILPLSVDPKRSGPSLRRRARIRARAATAR